MPQYVYEHPKTGKIIEVIQGINDKHEYVDGKGVKWRRVFTVPNAGIDTKIDAFSEKEFRDKTSNKKGKLGDLFDRSKELSQKRQDKLGVTDPLVQKSFDDYAKKRRNKRHPNDPKKNQEVTLDFGKVRKKYK